MQQTTNLSVTEDDSSLVTQWFGKDHFKESNSEPQVAPTQEESAPAFVTPGGMIYPGNSAPSQPTCPCSN